MAGDDAKLLDLAGRVSDGHAVDWAAEEQGADDGQRAVIRHLRLLSDIAQVHRSAPEHPRTAPPRALAAAVQQTIEARPSGAPGGASATVAPAPAADADAPRRWGHLEIRERLGTGAFGDVYRAWDGTLHRDVALKLLKRRPERNDGDRARKVLREGRMMARVRHPNVVTVHGADVHDERVGLWMEFVRGRSLDEARRAHGTYGAHEATLIGIDLCRALAAVHAAGLVHRDVKAHNVMREEGGRIVLMDFGAGEERSQAAVPGSAISGTPLYIAPEIYEGAAPDARSDIYSLGVLLYNLVTGRFPVEADSITQLRERLDRREIALLRDVRSDLPDAFVRIVQRAVAHDPAERFATVGQMEEALHASLGTGGAPAGDTARPRPQRRALYLVGAVVLLGAAVAAWLALGGAGYTVDATLYRVGADGSLTELRTGDAVQLGEELALDIEASAELWVYVLERDARGRAYAFFPLRGFELQNPLPANVRHRLPGVRDGVARTWRVDSVGEREEILIVASRERLPDFEIELGKLAEPDAPQVAPRGIGGLGALPRRVDAAAASDAFRMATDLATPSGETVEGRWLRRIELVNP